MPRKRKSSANVFSGAVTAADEIHLQDQVAESRAKDERGQRALLPLDQIQLRSLDTRPVRPRHVEALAESIAALGLIEPLVVDTEFVLLAGAHRLAAIKWLRENKADEFSVHFSQEMVPVRVMPLDSGQEPEKALQVELAENEKRVNYSRDQIEKLATRLRELNYKETRGRPKKGEKALGPALAVAIGVSTRYVRKVLGEENKVSSSKNRNSVPIFRRRQLLRRIEGALEELMTSEEASNYGNQNRELNTLMPNLLQQVKASLEELDT